VVEAEAVDERVGEQQVRCLLSITVFVDFGRVHSICICTQLGGSVRPRSQQKSRMTTPRSLKQTKIEFAT
jgi:hypothetical protein